MVIKVAIAQFAPQFLDLGGSVKKALAIIEEAADQGCQLVAFGETWLCGYPAWLDYVPKAALWDYPATKQVYASMHDNALIIPGPEIDKFCKSAKKRGIAIAIGATEKGNSSDRGTLYNSFVVINSRGELINHHRKLMPTFTEKLLYGTGDASGLRSSDLGGWRLGGLICWEHWMPLSRQALHDQGEDIHIALWPKVHEMHQVASRHYAFEGRCFVLAIGQLLEVKDLPEELEVPSALASVPEHLLLDGGSCIIGPDGKYIYSPTFNSEGLIVQELELNRIKQEQLTLDVSGHYQRPDIFRFSVKKPGH